MIDLFGLRYDSEAITAFLDSQPPHRADKPNDGKQYVISKAGGFDLLFEDEVNRGAGNRQNRVLSAIFLFNEGVDKHLQWRGELPFGFSFEDGRDGLRDKRTPEKTWVIGEGRVGLDHPEPDHDSWEMQPLNISAHYGADGEEIRYFIISPPSTEPEWVAPDTWENLALIPERKVDAIKLYREKHTVGMAEAKLAVERYAAERAR